MRNRYTRIVAIAGLVVVLGLGGVATVAAQGPTFLGDGGGFRLPRVDERLEAIAGLLGLRVEDLRLQFWGGRTLADIAEKAGVDLKEVHDAVAASREDARRAAIEQAVAEGTITQEHADWLLEGMDNGYDAEAVAIRRSLLGADLMMRGDDRPELGAIAEALDMTPEELATRLRDGEVLADLAEQAGIPLQELKSASDAAREARIREAIEVALDSEAISEEQADWLLRGLEAGYLGDGAAPARAIGRRGRMPRRMMGEQSATMERPLMHGPAA
jgi:hypothetical protein